MPGRAERREAARKGPRAEPIVPVQRPPQALTLELLDWTINGLTAVLATWEIRDPANILTRAKLVTALKAADSLYLSTPEASRGPTPEAEPRSTAGVRPGG